MYCCSINCYCGNRAPENDQKVFESDCDTPCAGDSAKTCGGEDRIQIYDLMSNICTLFTSFYKTYYIFLCIFFRSDNHQHFKYK